MTKPSDHSLTFAPHTFVCALALVAACGGRSLEAESSGETEGSSSTGSSDSDVSVTVTTTMTTDPTTTMTTDPTSTDPVTTDPDSTGAPETTGSPGDGCCEPHATPSCEEEEVATCVCKVSPECCVFEWADNCVELAMGDCAATCMGPAESSGSGEESSTGDPGGACEENFELEYLAEDAVLSGAWMLVDSMAKPGMMVATTDFSDPESYVTWSIDVPCDDDWHIWVRAFDNGQADSFFARQDGGPDPAPIFEVDCTFGGGGYAWRELNWRDPEMGMACEYVEDPWLAQWDAGTHEFSLQVRESQAVARIIVTNDDAYVPQ